VAKVELDAGASLLDLIESLEIPDRMSQMVLVNGQQAKRDRESRAGHALEEGDVVAIFPPVAGG
jgi:sulfur carrier protein ThiS